MQPHQTRRAVHPPGRASALRLLPVCRRAAALSILALAMLLSPASSASQPATPATPLAAADAAMAAGDFAAAARTYEAWLQAHPPSAPVLLALGACYLQLGRASDAARVLRQHVAVTPQSAPGRALLGLALLDEADAGPAERELAAALAIDPDEPTALEAQARLHMLRGEPAAAVPLLRRVRTPSAAVRVLLAEALARGGDPAGASAILEPELAEGRGTVETYALAAWARMAAGEPVRAAELAEEGMRRWPDSAIASVYLTLPPPVLAERTVLRLKGLEQRPEVAEMVALARILIDVDPTRKTRGLALARTLLEQALARSPRQASAQHHLARVLRESDIPAALAAWNRALAMGPADELALQIHTQMAKASQAISDARGADAAFRAALVVNRRLHPRVPEPALEYVRFLREEGRSGEADTLLAEVFDWTPWSPAVRLERARQFDAAGVWERVVSEGEFVLRTAGDAIELRRVAHLLLAKAHHRLKQPDKAREHAEWLKAH